jgi:hypothetical protein
MKLRHFVIAAVRVGSSLHAAAPAPAAKPNILLTCAENAASNREMNAYS